ncbi:MAG: hypothetical protein ACK4IX_06840, partial [Candidatus Sericytochromatia bacterium]
MYKIYYEFSDKLNRELGLLTYKGKRHPNYYGYNPNLTLNWSEKEARKLFDKVVEVVSDLLGLDYDEVIRDTIDFFRDSSDAIIDRYDIFFHDFIHYVLDRHTTKKFSDPFAEYSFDEYANEFIVVYLEGNLSNSPSILFSFLSKMMAEKGYYNLPRKYETTPRRVLYFVKNFDVDFILNFLSDAVSKSETDLGKNFYREIYKFLSTYAGKPIKEVFYKIKMNERIFFRNLNIIPKD